MPPAHGFFILEVRRTQSPKSPLLLLPMTSSGVLKTTLRVNNWLEWLTELTESCFAHHDNSLQLKDTLNSAIGSDARGRVQESSKDRVFNCPLPVESWTTLLSREQWVTICTEHCQAGKLTEALTFKLFTVLGLHGQLPTWLASVSSLCRGQADITWLKDSPYVTM